MEEKKGCNFLINEIKRLKYYKRIEKEVGEKAIIFFFVLIISGLIIISLNPFNTVDDYTGGLVVEATGFLFDIVLFGLFLMIYEYRKEKKNKIEHYIEEIDDYRGWNEKEASYRIMGSIRRLHKLNIYSINLSECSFYNVEFKKGYTIPYLFDESILFKTKFYTCIFHKCDFSKVLTNGISCNKDIDNSFGYTQFTNCNIEQCNFSNKIYSFIEFKNFTSFSNCYLEKTVFNDCIFKNVYFNKNVMKDLRFGNCIFINTDLNFVNENISFERECLFIDCENDENQILYQNNTE